MREKKWIFLKKESRRLYLLLAFFLLCGIWYSHTAAKGTLQMGEATTLDELAEISPPEATPQEVLGKINLNTADKEELMRLSGIGEKRAADIIAYRQEKGGFRSIEEIMEISGIGEKLFTEIQDDITIEQ